MTPSNNKSTTEQCRNQQGAEPPVDDSMDISESTNSNNEEAVLSNNVEKLPFLWQMLSDASTLKDFYQILSSLMNKMKSLPGDDLPADLQTKLGRFREADLAQCRDRKNFANALVRFQLLSISMNTFDGVKEENVLEMNVVILLHVLTFTDNTKNNSSTLIQCGVLDSLKKLMQFCETESLLDCVLELLHALAKCDLSNTAKEIVGDVIDNDHMAVVLQVMGKLSKSPSIQSKGNKLFLQLMAIPSTLACILLSGNRAFSIATLGHQACHTNADAKDSHHKFVDKFLEEKIASIEKDQMEEDQMDEDDKDEKED